VELAVLQAIFEIDLSRHTPQVQVGDDPFVREQPQQRLDRQVQLADLCEQFVALMTLRSFASERLAD